MIQIPQKQTPLNLEEGLGLFDQLADMNDIAFGFLSDGCFARAHIMCRRMQDVGLDPGKAWAFEAMDKLQVNLPGIGAYKWWFHVAPAIELCDDNGKAHAYVIDPSLFDGPVRLKEWADIMGAVSTHVAIVKFGQSPFNKKGDFTPNERTEDYTDQKAASMMRTYMELESGKQRPVFESQVRQDVLNSQKRTANPSLQTDGSLSEQAHLNFQKNQIQQMLQGKTWISMTLHRLQQNDLYDLGADDMIATPKPRSHPS